MSTWVNPSDGRVGRALRALMPDGNPLRRTCDRVEAWTVIALGVLFVLGAPVVAVIAGGYVYAASVRAEQISHPVTAILLANARRVDSGMLTATAPVSWTAPGGGARVGRVSVPAGARAGSEVATWAGASGQLTGAPPRGVDLAIDVAVAATSASVAVSALLMSAAVIVHCVVRRRRLARWETDWRSVEPRWARRS